MSSTPGSLLVFSINHETVPLQERELYSIEDARVDKLYAALQNQPNVRESLVLNTCNRFELYTLIDLGDRGEAPIIETLAGFYQLDPDQIQAQAKLRYGNDAVQHLIEVSAGLRSQITGEAEIFGQVKSAYALATQLKGPGKVINRVFQKGFQAAKLLRNSTQIGEGQINIANVAVDLSAKIFGKLAETSVVVIGTGDIGEKTTKALRSRGVRKFAVVSRTTERAKQVATEWGGQALTLEEVDERLFEFDIVIASTVTDSALITLETVKNAMDRRKERPLFLIDLGMPRNIDQSSEQLDNVFLYNLDDLATIASNNLEERQRAVEHCMEIAKHKATIIWQNLLKRDLVKD